MKVLLVPMIKNKTLISSDSRNYIPIALPTGASKLFELVLQNRISPYIYTPDAQFGFKAPHGTDMAIFSFKESVENYLNSGSIFFVCFLQSKNMLSEGVMQFHRTLRFLTAFAMEVFFLLYYTICIRTV